MRRVLRLATVLAHPDDETFGTGGTLIRYAREGVSVHSLCLTKGEQGWAGDPEGEQVPRERLGEARAQELHEAGRRMGLASTTALDFPDGGLASVPADEVRRSIAAWLRRLRPDVVITWGPDGGYGHPDHVSCGERALEAIELAAREDGPEGAAHRVARCYRFVASAEWLDLMPTIYPGFDEYMKTLAVRPERWTHDRLDAVIDVTEYVDAKWHAMQAHRTQAPDLKVWGDLVQRRLSLFREECFIRAIPAGRGPLEHDLFAALRAEA